MSQRMLLAAVSTLLVLSACGTSTTHEVTCEGGQDSLILAAQAVPEAAMLPCVTAYPTGWTHGGFLAKSGSVRFWMDSDRAGFHAVEVELSDGCDTSGATELPPDPGLSGVRRFEQPTTTGTQLAGQRLFRFDGGCVTLRYDFAEGADADLLVEAEGSVALVPRSLLVTALEENRDLVLCGVDAPPCP